MSVSYTMRYPDDLKRQLEFAAKSGGVSLPSLIVRACWQYLERSSFVVEQLPRDYPTVDSNLVPDITTLRAICAGRQLGPPTESEVYSEIPICSKRWWEDGVHYECLMDSGHRELKHGMRGMVRALDE